MSCVGDEHQSVYRPRSPQTSPLYQLLDTHFPEFEQTYAEKYAERYGPWRPAIARAVADCLKCGDLREGFARVHCPKCGHDLFVALSCRKRCLCPSCHQKQALLTGMHVAEEVCARPAPAVRLHGATEPAALLPPLPRPALGTAAAGLGDSP